MAFELAIIGVVVGIVLGLRYKVLVLVHAVMFAVNLSIIIGVARADSFWSIVLTTVAVVTALQLGYLAGIGIRATIESIGPPQNGDGKPDSKIAHPWQHMWQLDGWAAWGTIVTLHPLRPPQT